MFVSLLLQYFVISTVVAQTLMYRYKQSCFMPDMHDYIVYGNTQTPLAEYDLKREV
jgi:hypothetical protein